jgi:hypothetical protein
MRRPLVTDQAGPVKKNFYRMESALPHGGSGPLTCAFVRPTAVSLTGIP